MDYTTRDLICLRLAAVEDVREDGPVPEAVTVPGLDEALELGGSVADRVALLAELEALKGDGLVEEQVRPVADLDERRRAYVLTAAGRDRAAEIRRRACEETVTVGTTDDVPLRQVDQYFDDAPLVRALARMTPDGRVPIDTSERARVVGRSAELDRLDAAYEDLETRGGHAAFIAGESGVGKTTLVDEFLEQLPAGTTVARATAEPDSGRPYDVVRTVYDTLPLDGGSAALLSDVGLQDDQADEVAGQRQSLFADFADGFRDLAEGRPLVLVFEDVHNADEETIDLLEYLLEALGQWVYRVLFVLTYRPEVVGEDHALGALLESAAGERHDHLQLDPLDVSDTETILRTTLDAETVPEGFVRTVHEETGGNPLFVEAIASRVRQVDPGPDGDRSLPASVSEITVPETVSSAVQERLSVLDERGRRVLELGAVVGEVIDPAVLLAAADLPAPTVRDYVDLLVESGIWNRRDDDTIEFVQGVVRGTVLDGLAADTRAEYHRRVASAIEAVADDVDARTARLARHHSAAGDQAAAARAFERAGDRASAVYAYDIALDSYERGLAAAQASETVSADRVASLARSVANVNLLVGNLDAAADSLAVAREHCPGETATADPDLAVLAGRLAISRGDFDAALARVADALDHLEDRLEGDGVSDATGTDRPVGDRADVETPCRLLDLRAEAEMRQGNHEAARRAASRQRDLAQRVNSPHHRARAHSQLGRVARHEGDFGTMRTHHEAALAIYERLDADYDVAVVKNGLAIAVLKDGDIDHAMTLFEEAMDTFEEMGVRVRLGKAHSNLGRVYLEQRRFDAATDAFRRALEINRDIGHRHLEVKTIHNLGLAALEQGDHDEAREHFETAVETCEDLGDRHGTAINRVHLARALLGAGDPEAAADQVTTALDTGQELGATSAVATARRVRGTLARARDDPDAAREAYERALAQFRELGERNQVARVSQKLAELAFQRGQLTTARDHAADALTAYEDLNATPAALEVLRLLVEITLEAGDSEAARTYCGRAIERFEAGESPERLSADREWFRDRLADLPAAGPRDTTEADDQPVARDR